MKILHTVESYYPSVGGMQEVVKQISEHLVKNGHSVTVATSKNAERKSTIINGVKIEEFTVKGNAVFGLGGEVDRYQKYLLNTDFDVITNFAAQQWATDSILPVLKKIKAKKVFVPTGFSAFYNPLFKNYFKKMRKWMSLYDMNVFLSNDYRDINFARKSRIKKIIVIPNGASEEEFGIQIKSNLKEALTIPDRNSLILHVGSHTGQKGHAEAINIFKKANIKNATLLLVGNSYSRKCLWKCLISAKLFMTSPARRIDNKQIIVTSLSRKDTVAAYQLADLFLFPSNIECSPIVLFEAMAAKTAFLVTDVGNAKEIISWSKGGLLLPTNIDLSGISHANISESVRLFESLISDKKLLIKLSNNGYRSWNKKYRWDKIADSYETMYKKLLKRKEKK